MVEKDFAQGNIGSVGKYDVAFKSGQMVLEIDAVAGASSAGLIIKIDAAQVMDAIAKAIPGTVDDAVIGLVKAALIGA